MASGGLYLFIAAVIITLCAIYCQHIEDTIADGHNGCVRYKGKAESRFKKTSWIPALDQNKIITEITVEKRTSFYICYKEFVEPEKIIQNFGKNGTHWYVKSGCGGTFWIKECNREAA